MSDDLQTPPLETATPPVPTPEPVSDPQPGFGWTAYAERINGRFAMVGIIALILLELVTGQDFLTWMGVR
ncbi:chlorophyll a/b-binding protein [Prochlorothrix hollandica]|uniref:Chlorophyll A-B-binding protein n=1 Tax=Prochlorothrix hollandica PCC 9006 = CALU 1027 TaxID=317619 RepID=A0A0M2PZN4_PROHO|nr:chlorophyll a/b-binding protein [Prochlorothrix hollandica]KKJ00164.1 chlorophyll A-B-binding protein [Prochlorothrix hollandica PCC 9006 = CALU 1027]